ncbi:hypothetical protein F4553_000939 [Allocatelliglobosispora scoriae]|uniref:CBM-cenC domain-containing protein n=1 Tax=Allocatelliglobosispora scoriae TaxID=643052 RepID=A0A841BL72_9ACTN|nr:carbohydrate binding domain-containing protein [Allocatelliglobosispora scoriae]MBB5867560.1 hypothetical protein [Allocatelliglobosispora scoriae]
MSGELLQCPECGRESSGESPYCLDPACAALLVAPRPQPTAAPVKQVASAVEPAPAPVTRPAERIEPTAVQTPTTADRGEQVSPSPVESGSARAVTSGGPAPTVPAPVGAAAGVPVEVVAAPVAAAPAARARHRAIMARVAWRPTLPRPRLPQLHLPRLHLPRLRLPQLRLPRLALRRPEWTVALPRPRRKPTLIAAATVAALAVVVAAGIWAGSGSSAADALPPPVAATASPSPTVASPTPDPDPVQSATAAPTVVPSPPLRPVQASTAPGASPKAPQRSTAPPKPATSPKPPAPGPLLSNGSFSSGTSPWWGSKPVVAVRSDSGRLRADVSSGTTQAWDAMVAHDFSPLIRGKSYTLSFDAASSVTRSIAVTVQMGGSPFTNTMWKNPSVDSSMSHYSYTFTSNVNTDWGLVSFQLGNNGAFTFWLDNVTLVAH